MSRFSVFKLKSNPDVAPPPPPKDPSPSLTPSVFYNKSLFSRSTASLAPSLSPESISGPATPSTPYPPMPFVASEFGKRTLATANGRAMAASPVPSASGASFRSIGRAGADYPMDGASTDSSGSCPNTNAADVRTKKSVFKLSSLAKRNKSKKDLSDTTSASGSTSTSTSVSEYEDPSAKPDGDEGISLPWNFQHNIHVDEGYIGLPPSWSTALSQVGFDDDEIAAIHARRRAASGAVTLSARQAIPHTTYSTNSRPVSPQTITVTPSSTFPSSAILLEPAPRSSSLGMGRDALRIHPPPLSFMTASAPPTSISTPARSPRTPSFSVRSFVSGIKNTLSSDSASTRAVGSARGESGEDSEPYVIVDGDGPDESVHDETLIEPYPLDASSVSSHQTDSSTRQDMSQEQQTPRTFAFPQIQVQRAHSESRHVSVASSVSRAVSPLSHSHSLPIPTPPRGYLHSNNSLLVSPSHTLSDAGARPGPVSAPPRAPPRRIYHVANASSDSCDEGNYAEPPPAYFSPLKEEWTPRKEKDGSGTMGAAPLPMRPIPPLPMQGILAEPSSTSDQDSREDQEASMSRDITAYSCVDGIPRTADEVMDISSCYNDNSVRGGMGPSQQARVLSPTPPLVIDKRMSKLAVMPPRISLHQEDNLEDWSESLFSAIGKGKRSSIVVESNGGDLAKVKKERRTTIRPMSPPWTTGRSGGSSSSSPSLPDISFGTNLTLGPVARSTIDEEGGEQEKVKAEAETEAGAKETRDDNDAKGQVQDSGATTVAEEQVKEVKASPAPPPAPNVTNGPSVLSLAKAFDPPSSKPSPPPRPSTDSIPPSPPPKPKRMPPPILLPPAVFPSPPRMNIITGISGKSPVNPLFGAKPQPLPIPIPPSQIRAQLRPAPPRSPHPPPTLPLPPLKRALSQPNLQPPPPPPQSQLPPIPSQKILKPISNAPPTSSPISRSNSSQTLSPARANPGDRDSGLSTITVTPATITMAKVVRKAVASVIDSDTVSLGSKRESVVSAANPESQTVAYDGPDINRETPRPQAQVPDDSKVSVVSSVSLLRDESQSKWPAPPPPPVERETDSSPRRVSRFRTTSLGRVSHLQAMGASPTSSSSHSSQESSDTTSSETSESVPTRGVNGASSVPKPKVHLAAEARLLSSTTGTFGGVDVETEAYLESPSSESHASAPPSAHPLLTQLQPYIAPRNPASCFTDLVEIAEGESGSVFAARVASTDGRQGKAERPIPPGTSHVAIKRIPLPPAESLPFLSDDSPISNKLTSVLHELSLLRNLDHEHLLLPDGVYVGPGAEDEVESAGTVDTSLWIRMELMERSLADVIGLVAEGLALQERLVARFASDVLNGLDYLQRQHIAHRDVRSDNLLVSASGVVKLADFSNAIRVDRNAPTVSGAVGVIYWQAPEMRAGPYNALKVDVWSLGATVWELAETVPPFSMPASLSNQTTFALQSARHVGSQWPLLTHPEHYSRAFHEFLRLCGRESAGRPCPGELLNTPFIRNACGRPVILQLLSQCRAIEEAIVEEETAGSPS